MFWVDPERDLTFVRGWAEKRRLVESIGGENVAVIGNGANDVPMFKAASLGIAV